MKKYYNRPSGARHTHRLSTSELEEKTQQNRIKRFAKNHGYTKQSQCILIESKS